jgi:peroxiredoxin
MKRLKQIALFAALPAALVLTATMLPPDASSNESDPEAVVGEQAPDFTLEGTDGKTYTLSDLEGEYVVLEWLNFQCPYVGKHYGSGNMQKLQKKYTEKGVKWLSVVSSAPGKQGHYPPKKMNAMNKKRGGHQTAILMDESGKVGRTYGARTTPHMYVINPEGELIYKGGIDDKPTIDEADIKTATNYVSAALDASMNGEKVETKKAPPYGCSIKYAAK